MRVICPDGHASSTDDYCDQCGARIAASDASTPGVAPCTGLLPALTTVAVRPPAAAERCPGCGASLMEDDRFCEDCGYDFEAGAPSALPAIGRWTAVVSADREQFERFAAGGIEFPPSFAPRVLPLDAAEIPLGRDEVGGDPAVSRLHAVLIRRADGAYAVVDRGSSNGTFLNDEPSPIPANVPVPLDAGDRVHLGAWTTITLVPPSGSRER
jgi:hypothetical protein